MHPSKKDHIAYLKANKIPIKFLSKYANFADIFSPRLDAKLLERTAINDYTILLIDN